MMLKDLAKVLKTDVPTLAKLSTLGDTWSDATDLDAGQEKVIRANYASAEQVAK